MNKNGDHFIHYFRARQNEFVRWPPIQSAPVGENKLPGVVQARSTTEVNDKMMEKKPDIENDSNFRKTFF